MIGGSSPPSTSSTPFAQSSFSRSDGNESTAAKRRAAVAARRTEHVVFTPRASIVRPRAVKTLAQTLASVTASTAAQFAPTEGLADR